MLCKTKQLMSLWTFPESSFYMFPKGSILFFLKEEKVEESIYYYFLTLDGLILRCTIISLEGLESYVEYLTEIS